MSPIMSSLPSIAAMTLRGSFCLVTVLYPSLYYWSGQKLRQNPNPEGCSGSRTHPHNDVLASC